MCQFLNEISFPYKTIYSVVLCSFNQSRKLISIQSCTECIILSPKSPKTFILVTTNVFVTHLCSFFDFLSSHGKCVVHSGLFDDIKCVIVNQ